MSFSELTTTGRWAPFSKEMEQALAQGSYLFDALVISMSFAFGALVAWIVRKLFVRLATAIYSRFAKVDAEVSREIVRLSSCIVWTIPIASVCLYSDVKGMHAWLLFLLLRLCLAATAVLVTASLCHAINLLGFWYRTKLASKNRPIDGILMTLKAFVCTAGLICVISLVADQSPVVLLSALGAATAVLLLVFRDSLLSIAASVQVNTSQLINIGDWIVQEKMGVDGFVESMTLHMVKVRNLDATVIALPVRVLVEEPFVNMTRMQERGGRRYKRTFSIDFRSVRFLRQSELDELRRFDRLHAGGSPADGGGAAEAAPATPTVPEGGHQTNLGAFRSYLLNYLRHHPHVCKDKTMIVTALEPTSRGVPLEITVFTCKTDNAGFHEVAADITEHVLAVLPSFRLRMFQQCSDIYQSVAGEGETVDGLFRYETYANPEAQGRASRL